MAVKEQNARVKK
jgi:hypothetical protein